MTEVNIPLLRKAVEWAEAEAAKPRELCEWYQPRWASRATLDVFMDYTTVVSEPDGVVVYEAYSKSPECGTCFCIAGYTATIATGDENLTDPRIAIIAQKELGLTDTQAFRLFHASNTIQDVRNVAEAIAGERL